MNYLFFLLIPFLLIPSANAEVGKNFDTDDLGNGMVQWTSHYPRTWDGSQWQNYLWSENGNTISFESARMSYELDKTTCTFKVKGIEGYGKSLSIDGNPEALTDCTIENIIPLLDGLQITTNQNSFETQLQTTFDVRASGSNEWTYEISNQNPAGTKQYSIDESCIGCKIEKTDGDLIYIEGYVLDTKNREHKTLTDVTEGKDLVLSFDANPIKASEKVIIDPVLTNNNPTEDFYIDDGDNDGLCEETGGSYTKTSGTNSLYFGLETNVNVQDCYRTIVQWSLAGLPNNATIINTNFLFDVDITSAVPRNCDVWNLEYNATGKSEGFVFRDAGNGTNFISNNAFCTTTGNDKSLDLGTSADAIIQTHSGTDDFFGVGLKNFDETGQDASTHWGNIDSEEFGGSQPKPTLQVTYSYPHGAVTTLVATDIRPKGVDLDWGTPSGTGIDGYQINYTTPWSSNVATISKDNTNSLGTAYSVSGLTGSTQYSFRVGTRDGSFVNASGNVLNVTTDYDPTADFSVGTFKINQTGTDTRPITFERDDINSTALFLNVTYSDTIDLACDLRYKFANTNNTYTIFTNSSAGSGKVESPMLLLDVDNEIIDVNCFDENGSDATGKYLITQTAFPLLTYIDAFRNGEFGTSGNFGVLDFITLIAIIIGMVGFNRVNPSVGLVFSIFIVGGLAVFGIIQWPTIMTAGIVLIAMFIIGSTRKDD